jgi:RNA polymerase sigma-70 factor (ECF subfamily)
MDMGEMAQQEESEVISVESIRNALTGLPDHYRVVLTLHLLEGYDYQEISQITGTKESTIRTLYMRGRQKLAEALRK